MSLAVGSPMRNANYARIGEGPVFCSPRVGRPQLLFFGGPGRLYRALPGPSEVDHRRPTTANNDGATAGQLRCAAP